MANSLILKDTTLHVGDTVKIDYKFSEGGKEKEQAFEGTLIKIAGAAGNKMFTMRKVGRDQIGVERVFPAVSPFIQGVSIVKKGSVRRSKLYFIRGLSDQKQREKLS